MVKTTLPLFKSSISPSKKPLLQIFEIFYHTILPCIVTYLIVAYGMPYLFILLLIPIFIRFRPEMIRIRREK